MGCMDGKVAIVTGGGRGIGREECLLLASEGARVVVNDFGGSIDGSGGDVTPAQEVVELIRSKGGEAIANGESVSSFQGAKSIVDVAVSTFGRLDALVNNAGIIRDRMLYNMSEEEFDAVIAVHLKGHFNCARWASSYWRDEFKKGNAGTRHIVNTTSGAGLIGNRGQTNYAAAKAGIAMMTRVWAMDLESYDVKVNAIAPLARTRITEATFGDFSSDDGGFDIMSPANVAPLAVFLASDLSSGITGEVFGIRGGDLDRYFTWSNPNAINKDGRWTPTEIAGRIGELF